jgi:hypothetical protein
MNAQEQFHRLFEPGEGEVVVPQLREHFAQRPQAVALAEPVAEVAEEGERFFKLRPRPDVVAELHVDVTQVADAVRLPPLVAECLVKRQGFLIPDPGLFIKTPGFLRPGRVLL